MFIDENGKVRAKPVVSGASDLTDTVVLAGLSEGDKVIAGPFKALVVLNDGKLVVDEAKVAKEKVNQSKAEAAAGEAKDKDDSDQPGDDDSDQEGA